MRHKSQREGYLLIDNRLAPPTEGVPRFVELATSTCSHCQRQILRNPARQRDRAWCPNCDSYVCDQCDAVRQIEGCKPMSAVIDKLSRNMNNLRII